MIITFAKEVVFQPVSVCQPHFSKKNYQIDLNDTWKYVTLAEEKAVTF